MYKNQFFHVRFWVKRGISVCLLALFVLLLSQSEVVLYSARQGLTLWAISVVPALLPFIILSRFWIYYDIPGLFIQASNRLFRQTPTVAVTVPLLLLGLSSGFPVGAMFIRHFYEKNYISKPVAEKMIPLCSFVSPMFLSGYVFSGFSGTKTERILLIIALYLPILLLYIDILRNEKETDSFPVDFSLSSSARKESSIRDIWLSSLEIILTIGIYMMLFSILFALGKQLRIFSGTTGTFLLSCLEVTTGSHALLTDPSVCDSLRTIVLAGCLSFGGLCTGLQVKTVLGGSHLSMKPYHISKLFAAGMSMILLWVLEKLLC